MRHWSLLLSAVCMFLFPGGAFAATMLSGTYDKVSLHLTRDGSPYVVEDDVYIGQYSNFRIEGGVVVKFKTATSSLRVHGAVPIKSGATAEAPIYFTSYKDDAHGGDTNGDGNATAPAPGDWGFVSFGCGTIFVPDNTRLSYMRVTYGGANEQGTEFDGALHVCFHKYNGMPVESYTLEHLVVAYNEHGLALVTTEHELTVRASSIHDNTIYGVKRVPYRDFRGNDLAGAADFSNNWWGDASGPYHPTINPGGTGDNILPENDYFRPITAASWLAEDPLPDPVLAGCTEHCNSNILFLPGIMGSRLYDGSEKLWEPSGETQVQQLYLNSDGSSANPSIRTKEVLDEIGPIGIDIYKPLLDDLEQKKGEQFEDYRAVAYDWRLAIPDILAEGEVEAALRSLAASSRTGKVSIVAHSNGGLVAKALMNVLGDEADDLVDKILLVAVPQLGTPQAIGSLLHGYDSGLPFDQLPLILSPERARDFAKNAPMAYQLLPHSDYYSTAGTTITTPIVSFEGGEATRLFTDAYGSVIGNGVELHNFISGQEGRPTPAYDDLQNPAIGNEALLIQTESLMKEIGSSWRPPEGIEVHQIAGIGENTLSGITYKTGKRCVRPQFVLGIVMCLQYEPALIYTPEETIDGDGTVVVPSALALSDDVDNVKRWWVDLDNNNDDNDRFWIFRVTHGDILVLSEVRMLIFKNILLNQQSVIPSYVYQDRPPLTSESSLRFILHSPLALSASDNSGNIASETENSIPGATFKRYGEVQVISVPADVQPTVMLNGTASGSFTMEVEQYAGDALVATTTFSGIPSATSTSATMSFPDGTIENASDLALDYDGNGVVDAYITPEAGEEVLLSEPSLSQLIAMLKATIANLDIKQSLKKRILELIEQLEKSIEKKSVVNQRILDNTMKQLMELRGKGKIVANDVAIVLELLRKIESSI